MSDRSGPSQPRRRVGHVTSNACTECRKKRSKCDGATPCSRCVVQEVECVYERPVKHTKDEMRAEIEELRHYKERAESLFDSLKTADAEKQREILSCLRESRPLPEIAQWHQGTSTKTGGSYNTTFQDETQKHAIHAAIRKAGFMAPGGQSDYGDDGLVSQQSVPLHFQDQKQSPRDTNNSYQTSTVAGTPRVEIAHQEEPLIMHWSRSPSETTIQESRRSGQQGLLGSTMEAHGASGNDEEPIPETWTRITDDMLWVKHLLALYFCWEYPTFASLSKDHFLEDFRAMRHRYCSPLLVNAMLAMGCRFSGLPDSRADPNDPTTAGDHFFAEAKRLLSRERNMVALATIQAIGLMAIREGSCGRDTESLYYCQLAIRIAVENGLHHESAIADSGEREVRRATFWGAFTLDQCWCLCLSRMPHLSYASDFPPKPSIISRSELTPWKPYTDWGEPQYHIANQPCNVHSVYKCFGELSNLIHSSLYTMYSPQQKFTSQELVYHYETYMNWYDEMPDVLRLGSNFTPAVLFVHIYYHFAVLSLFLPFIHLRLRGSFIIPRQIVLESAMALMKVVRFYRDLYSLSLTPSMAPYLLLTSTVALMKALADEGIVVHGGSGAEGKAKHGPLFQHAGGDDDEQNDDDSTWHGIDPQEAVKALRDSILALQEMTKCHGFATRALEIVKFLAGKWDVDVMVGLRGNEVAQETDINMLDAGNLASPIKETPTRKYPAAMVERDWLRVKPKANSTNLFVPRAEIGDDNNVLFSVFPLQGLPLVGEGDELEADGFIIDSGPNGPEFGKAEDEL